MLCNKAFTRVCEIVSLQTIIAPHPDFLPIVENVEVKFREMIERIRNAYC